MNRYLNLQSTVIYIKNLILDIFFVPLAFLILFFNLFFKDDELAEFIEEKGLWEVFNRRTFLGVEEEVFFYKYMFSIAVYVAFVLAGLLLYILLPR